MRNGTRADEGDMAYIGMGCQMICGLGPANDGLDELRRVPTGGERGASNRGKILRRPGCAFRSLDDDSRTCKEG